MSSQKKSSLSHLKQRVFSSLEDKLDEISERVDQISKVADNTRGLVLENIIEERNRADKKLSGGTYMPTAHELVTRIFNDSIMYLDPKDIAVVPHIVLEGIWEKPVTNAWLSLMGNKNQVVLDIGANFGYFGMLAAQSLGKKSSNVILFEANPQLIPYINKTLSVNWLHENTTIEQVAISDAAGKASLNVLEDYTGSSSMHSIEHLESYLSHKMKIKAESVIEVPTITIDGYCKSNKLASVDLIKMDIEGFEEKAYAGMRETVKKSAELTLFIEFTQDGYDNPKKFFETMLEDFGNIYTIDPAGKFVIPKDTNFEKFFSDKDDWTMLVFSKKNLVASTNKQ